MVINSSQYSASGAKVTVRLSAKLQSISSHQRVVLAALTKCDSAPVPFPLP